MTTGVAAPIPILQFFDARGYPLVGGSVLTQVGGVNTATYQDSGLTTPLPNPIPLNARGEISTAAGASSQIFLTPNQVYTFTLSDANGNQIWVATYLNGVQVNQASIANALWPKTTAENTVGITIVNPQYPSDQGLIQAARYSSTNTWDYRTDQRLFEIYLSKYGAVFNGTSADPSDDSAAIADSINAMFALVGSGGPRRVFMPSGGLTAKISTAGIITWYCGAIGIDFNGLIMDASSITSGNVITVTGRGSAPYSGYASSAPIENFNLLGPTTGTPTTVLMYLNGGSPQNGEISGGFIKRFRVYGGNVGMQFASNVYILGFEDFYVGNALQYGIYWQGGSNTGENINWRNGQISNCVNMAQNAIGLYMSSGAADTDMYFSGVSFDYCNQLIDQRSGHLQIEGHLETGITGLITSAPGFVNVQQDSATAEIATFMFRGKVNMGGTPANVFTCSKGLATDVRIHAHVDNYSGTTQLVNITDSSAVNVEFKGNLQLWTGTTLYGPLNTTYNGDFELGNLNGWTVAGAAIFSVQSTTKHSGTYALEATAASASTGSEYQVIPVRQGQRIYSDLWVNVTAITGGTFGAQVNFYSDSALTNKIGTGFTAAIYSAVTTGWAESSAQGVVPAGANYMGVSVYTAGFIGTAYVDDIKVAIF